MIAGIKQLFRFLDAVLIKRTGAARFDILVNNASIAELGTIEETSEELFDRNFAINVRAVYFLTKDALSHLNDVGRIINVSSGGTPFAEPSHSAHYMTKGAVNNLTLTLAKQLGKRGITVNSLAPGVTRANVLAPIKCSVADSKVPEPGGLSIFRRTATQKSLLGKYSGATFGVLGGQRSNLPRDSNG